MRHKCDKDENLDPEGTYHPEVFNWVPKYPDQVRLCLGVAINLIRNNSGHISEVAERLPALDYSKKTIIGNDRYERLMGEEIKRVKNLKDGGKGG